MTAIDRLLEGSMLSGSDGLTGYLSMFSYQGTLYGIHDTGTPYPLAPSPSTGMTSFTLAGDSGTPQTITNGNTVTLAGGTGIDTVAGATDTVTFAIDSTVATLTGVQILTNKTLTTPTIGDLTNAQHNHTNAAGGGQITDAALSAAVGIAKGGTGQTTATAAFDALAPTTTTGDISYYNGTDNVRLPIGATDEVLTVIAGVPAWEPSGSSAEYPTSTIIFADEFQVTAGAALAYFDLLPTQQHGYVRQSSSGAVNDAIAVDFTAQAGTYTLEILYFKQSSGGIITFSIDAGALGTTVDTYAAVNTYNQRTSITSITVTGDGLHTLLLTAATKNASSSNYYMAITTVTLRRTGA